MKVLPRLLLLAILSIIPPISCALAAAKTLAPPIFKAMWIEQQVDHFDFFNSATFMQKYLVNESCWVPGGPIFFYTGNEGPIELFTGSGGQMWEWAQEAGALVVFAEHRYYGDSIPSVNYRYLTSEQALADYAHLVEYLRSEFLNCSSCRLIAFGGSYGGMLSAWFRLKYPYLVNGAWSSSAPFLWFGTMDKQYAIGDWLSKIYSPFCAPSIHTSWGIIGGFAQSQAGRQRLQQAFNLCSPLNSPTDVSALFSALFTGWLQLGEFNFPIASDFLLPLPAWPVSKACSSFNSNSVTDPVANVEAVASAIGVYYNSSGNGGPCFNLSTTSSQLEDPIFGFQLCTELVGPLSLSGKSDIFFPTQWSLESFTQHCVTKYNVTPRWKWISNYYGDGILTPGSGSNIIFTRGELDPFFGVCLSKSVSPSLTVLNVPRSAHVYDMMSSSTQDPPEITTARQQVKQTIMGWLKQ